MSLSLPILIAGGGPVGTIAALALARQGVPVQVFEADDRVNDAPRANEILIAIAVTDSGRPLPRVGGLKKEEIKGEDGLR